MKYQKALGDPATKSGKTVAEFVANEHIYNKVKELNIDYSQGYFFDKPLKYEDIV